jgi:hypothetical protein
LRDVAIKLQDKENTGFIAAKINRRLTPTSATTITSSHRSRRIINIPCILANTTPPKRLRISFTEIYGARASIQYYSVIRDRGTLHSIKNFYGFFKEFVTPCPDGSEGGFDVHIGLESDALKGASVGVSDTLGGEIGANAVGQVHGGYFAVGAGGFDEKRGVFGLAESTRVDQDSDFAGVNGFAAGKRLLRDDIPGEVSRVGPCQMRRWISAAFTGWSVRRARSTS